MSLCSSQLSLLPKLDRRRPTVPLSSLVVASFFQTGFMLPVSTSLGTFSMFEFTKLPLVTLAGGLGSLGTNALKLFLDGGMLVQKTSLKFPKIPLLYGFSVRSYRYRKFSYVDCKNRCKIRLKNTEIIVWHYGLSLREFMGQGPDWPGLNISGPKPNKWKTRPRIKQIMWALSRSWSGSVHWFFQVSPRDAHLYLPTCTKCVG